MLLVTKSSSWVRGSAKRMEVCYRLYICNQIRANNICKIKTIQLFDVYTSAIPVMTSGLAPSILISTDCRRAPVPKKKQSQYYATNGKTADEGPSSDPTMNATL